MSLDEFKKIIDTYDYPIEKIQFCGTGEPTANRNLAEMIRYVVDKKAPKAVELITNATFLTPELSRALVEAGVTSFKVSIDGPDEKTYQAVRRHGLKSVVENLKVLKKAVDESGKSKSISVGINCVITISNIENLGEMPRFAKDIGVNILEMRIFETNLEAMRYLAVHDQNKLDRLKEKVEGEAKRLGIECNFWDFEEIAKENCNLINEVNINCEGYLTPCYHFPDKHIGAKLGDGLFSAYWNGRETQKVIENIENKNFFPECSCLAAVIASNNSLDILPCIEDELKKINSMEGEHNLKKIKKLISKAGEKKILFVTPTGRNLEDIRTSMNRIFNADSIGRVGFSDLISIKGKRHAYIYSIFNGASVPEFMRTKDTDYGKYVQERQTEFVKNQKAELLKSREKRIYKESMRESLKLIEKSCDLNNIGFIFLEDIYALGLIPLLKKEYPHIKLIWVVHREYSRPLGITKKFLWGYLKDADGIAGWSKNDFPEYPENAEESIKKKAYILPVTGLNPLDCKNIELDDEYLDYIRTKYNISKDRKVIFQLGRFVLVKDFYLTLRAYAKLKKHWDNSSGKLPQLVFACPSFDSKEDPKSLFNYKKDLIKKKAIDEGDVKIINLTLPEEKVEFQKHADQAKRLLLRLALSHKDNFGNYLRKIAESLDRVDTKDEEVRKIINFLEVNALERIADLGMHVSMYESFGVVITELLWKGKPVIASTTGGIPEQYPEKMRKEYLINISEKYEQKLRDIESKYKDSNYVELEKMLEEAGDPSDELSEKMSAFFKLSEEERKDISRNFKEYIRKRYLILNSVERHLCYLKQLSASRFYSPFLKNEFGEISSEDYETMLRIKGIMEEEIDKDPDRYIIDILKKINDKDVKKLLGMVNKSIKGSENAGLDKLRKCLAYKALILVVRDWPKKDLHCHVSDSLDDGFGLQQLRKNPEKKESVLGILNLKEEDIEKNPCGKKIKDAWIFNREDFILAVRHAVRQYFEDGVTMVELRFNPYKKEFMRSIPSAKTMQRFLREVARAVSEEEEKANNSSGYEHKVRFMFSLNRGKYPGEIIDIIKGLCSIKEKAEGLLNERMYGIDISGPEMNEWEFNDKGKMTHIGKKLLAALQKARSSDFKIASHLGHSSSVDKRYREGGRLAEYKTLHQFKYIGYYISIDGFSRIGHGSEIKQINPDDKHKDEAEEQLSFIIGKLKKEGVAIERCPSGSSKTLNAVRKETPVYFWKKKGIKFVLGVDGLNKSISLSQWVAMLLLAAPKHEGWTVEYLRNIVSDDSAKELDENILHAVGLQQHRISGI